MIPAAEITIDEIVAADAPESWRQVGFEVDNGSSRIGTVRVRLAGADAGRGLVGWSLRGVATPELDGLPTAVSTSQPAAAAAEHPNGAVSIDHVVAFSPDLDRTRRALESAGLPLRRVREGPTPGGAMRQAFFRLADVILEVIEQPSRSGALPDPKLPAKLWGLAFRVESLEDCGEKLGDHLGSARDAVQPGRRIATLRRSAGLSVRVAFITRERRG